MADIISHLKFYANDNLVVYSGVSKYSVVFSTEPQICLSLPQRCKQIFNKFSWCIEYLTGGHVRRSFLDIIQKCLPQERLSGGRQQRKSHCTTVNSLMNDILCSIYHTWWNKLLRSMNDSAGNGRHLMYCRKLSITNIEVSCSASSQSRWENDLMIFITIQTENGKQCENNYSNFYHFQMRKKIKRVNWIWLNNTFFSMT